MYRSPRGRYLDRFWVEPRHLNNRSNQEIHFLAIGIAICLLVGKLTGRFSWKCQIQVASACTPSWHHSWRAGNGLPAWGAFVYLAIAGAFVIDPTRPGRLTVLFRRWMPYGPYNLPILPSHRSWISCSGIRLGKSFILYLFCDAWLCYRTLFCAPHARFPPLASWWLGPWKCSRAFPTSCRLVVGASDSALAVANVAIVAKAEFPVLPLWLRSEQLPLAFSGRVGLSRQAQR